jgi:hypothetical protein
MSASESWSPQRDALAAEVLRRRGQVRLQVRGESMLPTLWPGDVAEIAACSLNDVSRSEIVLAYRDGRFFLHRFLGALQPESFTARGDSMPSPDPVFPAEALLGKLTAVIRAGQTVPVFVRPWSRAAGMLFCHCSVARRAALRFHSSRYSHLRVAGLETT